MYRDDIGALPVGTRLSLLALPIGMLLLALGFWFTPAQRLHVTGWLLAARVFGDLIPLGVIAFLLAVLGFAAYRTGVWVVVALSLDAGYFLFWATLWVLAVFTDGAAPIAAILFGGLAVWALSMAASVEQFRRIT